MAIVKGFIFDLDGVLVDTATYHYQAWKRMANNLGFDFSEKQNEELKRRGPPGFAGKDTELGSKGVGRKRKGKADEAEK
ncbi:MAG: HAD hydrolase-like protein [Owenweeksia sp.]|nr:HAD hydrolase-like protein [Owenweeksia sp.]